MDRRGYFMLLNKRDKYNYLAFTNLEDREITLTVKKNNANAPTVKFYYSDSEYSRGTYAETSTDGVSLPVPAGGVLYIRGVGNAAWATMTNDTTMAGCNTIGCSGRYAVSGKILSLLDAANVHSGRMSADAALMNIFSASVIPANATNLIDASGLLLPSLLRKHCFRGMFNGCAALEAMPEIPATEAMSYCFYAMFQNCTSLTETTKLDIEFGDTCRQACYRMFMGCTSLVSIGEGSTFHRASTTFPPETAERAMESMFRNCTSLLRGVDLDFNQLTRVICLMMYQGCTSLQAVPKLTNRTDGTLSISSMALVRAFKNCTSLTSIGAYKRFAGDGFGEMFMNCTGLTSLPQGMRFTGSIGYYTTRVDGAILSIGAKQSMFEGCTNLVDASGLSITVTQGNIGNKDCGMAFASLFKGCTSLTGAPDLSGVETYTGTGSGAGTDGIFHSAFYGCTSLVEPPSLPSPLSLPASAYNSMFYGCKKLARVPSISHITTVSQKSMMSMFEGCTSLTEAPDIDKITTFGAQCFFRMFASCSNIRNVPKFPNVMIASYQATREMFKSCSRMAGVAEFRCNSDTDNMFSGTKITGIILYNTADNGKLMIQGVTTMKTLDVNRFYPLSYASGNPAVFNYVFTLDSLTIRGDYAPASIHQNFINALSPTCTIKVHPNQVDAYKSAAVWSSRAAYISAIE